MAAVFLNLIDLFTAIFLAFLIVALGRQVLRLVGFRCSSFAMELAIAGGLGWGVLGYTIFALGTLGLVYAWVAYLLVASLVLWLWRETYRVASDIGLFLQGAWGAIRRDRVLLLISVMLALHVLLLTVGSLAPPSAGDATVYHLAAPKAYIEQRRVSFIPHVLWNQPFTAEMIYMLGMLLHRDVLASAINNLLAIWMLLSTYALSRHFFSRRVALLATLIFYSIPWVTVLAVSVKSDTAYTLFAVLALLALVQWHESSKHRWLVLAGVYLGFCAGSKGPGLVFAGAATMALGVHLFSARLTVRPWKQHVMAVVTLGITALVVASPWYVRNWIAAGDPIWPSGYNVFHGRYLDEAMARGWTTYRVRLPGFGWSPLALLLGPWNYTLRLDEIKGLLMPTPVIFLALAPGLALCWRELPERTKQVMKLILLVAMWAYVGWFYTLRETRFLLTIAPILALVSALVIRAALARASATRWLILTVFGLAQFFNLGFAIIYNQQFFPVVFGFQDRDTFLQQRISLYSTMQLINEQLPPERRVLLFMPNNYPLNGPKMLGDDFTQSWWFSSSDYRSASAFASRLVANRVTHILFDSMFVPGLGASLRRSGAQPDLVGNVFRPLEQQGCLVPIYQGLDHIVESRVRQELTPVDVVIYEVQPANCIAR